MLITDKIIFIELHKTGSSHTRKIFLDVFKDNCEILGKHDSYFNISENHLENFQGKIKIGNIRNPWDWYVSLWAFGCQKRGGLYNYLTSPYQIKLLSKKGLNFLIRNISGLEYSKLNRNKWESLYSDPYNIQNFNSWLNLLLDKSRHDIGEGYKMSKISKFAGFFTYRYLRLYTYNHKFDLIKSYQDLVNYDNNENFMDIILRNENLDENIIDISEKLGFTKNELKTILSKNKSKTNVSKRSHNYRTYYSNRSVELVEKYEKFIIDKYNYTFE